MLDLSGACKLRASFRKALRLPSLRPHEMLSKVRAQLKPLIVVTRSQQLLVRL